MEKQTNKHWTAVMQHSCLWIPACCVRVIVFQLHACLHSALRCYLDVTVVFYTQTLFSTNYNPGQQHWIN